MNTFHKPLPLRGGFGGHMIDFKNVFISYDQNINFYWNLTMVLFYFILQNLAGIQRTLNVDLVRFQKTRGFKA